MPNIRSRLPSISILRSWLFPHDKIEAVLEKVKAADDKEKRVMAAFHAGGSIADVLKILPAAQW